MRYYLKTFYLLFIFFNTILFASGIELTKKEKIWLKQNPHIKLTALTGQPPLVIIDKNGKHTGVLADIFNILSDNIGQKIELVPIKTDIHKAAKQKGFYGFSTVFKTPKHNREYLFTKEYLSTPFIIFTKDQNIDKIKSEKDLRGKRVALMKNHRAAEEYLNKIGDIKIIYAQTPLEQMQKVLSDEADALLGYDTYQYLINKYINISMAFKSKKKRNIYIGINPEHKILCTILDKAINKLSKEALNSIFEKWEVIPSKKDYNIILNKNEKKWLQEHKRIKLASDRSFFPFESVNENGVFEGIAADYIQLVKERLNIEFEISPREPWNEILKMVQNKKLDMFSCAVATSKRKGYASFTKPYISHPLVIITSDKTAFIDGIKGLRNKTIAIEKGYFSHDIIETNYPKLKLKLFGSSLSAIEAVSSGKADAYIGSIAVVDHLSHKYGITNIKVSGEIPFRLELAFGVRKEWQEFIPILQKALNSITEEEKNRIYKKWISLDQKNIPDYTLFWKSIFISILIVFIVLYWNQRLKKEIKRRKEIEKELYNLNKNLEKRVEEALEKTKTQQAVMFQQSRLAQMGEIISMIAHQWRQPLNNVSAMIQTISLKYKRDNLDNELMDQFKNDTMKHINYMSQTIDDFRSFFKPEKNKEDFCVCKLMEQIISLITPSNKNCHIDMEVDYDKDTIINTYKNELGQAILNFINNSRDALEHVSKDKKWIKVKIRKKEDHVLITVNDNAGGVSPHILTKIFDPYFSTKTEKNGTGLGLYMSKIIIEDHLKGELKIENNQFGLFVSIYLRREL